MSFHSRSFRTSVSTPLTRRSLTIDLLCWVLDISMILPHQSSSRVMWMDCKRFGYRKASDLPLLPELRPSDQRREREFHRLRARFFVLRVHELNFSDRTLQKIFALDDREIDCDSIRHLLRRDGLDCPRLIFEIGREALIKATELQGGHPVTLHKDSPKPSGTNVEKYARGRNVSTLAKRVRHVSPTQKV